MKRIANLMALLMALTIVGSAAAGGSTIVNGYGGKAGAVVGKVVAKHVTPKHSTPAVHTGTTLPFTGLNLTVACLAGLVLVGLGVALVRTSRHPNA
jgi:hypothetical protein